MPNSINTNMGAMVALQNLNSTTSDLFTTQNRISTGKRVNSAKDNGAIWAIAQNQRAASNSYNAVKESLSRGQSTVDVALAGGEAVSDLLIQMKEKALSASDSSLDAASRTALNDDFKALRDQLTKSVNNATFNGINMIKAAGTTIAALADDTELLLGLQCRQFRTFSGQISIHEIANTGVDGVLQLANECQVR